MVFLKRVDAIKPGYTVGHILARKPTKGDIGLEIEVEGKNLCLPSETPAPWVHVVDHSLRGEENAEYVLSKPIKFEDVPGALAKLWAALNNKGAVIDDSNRTSVHVHLNCQDFHLNRLASFAAMYFAMEEILTEWCGDHRVGNLFCLRAKDAPAIVTNVKKFIANDGNWQIGDNHHYAAFNSQALFKFGSIEIRTLRGVSDPKIIEDWVRILERLYRLSEDYKDPRQVCSMFSAEGPVAFFDRMLGEMSVVVRSGTGIDEQRIRDCMYDGIRLAQDIAYCRDWSLYQETKVRRDPFGRAPKPGGLSTSDLNTFAQYAALMQPGAAPVTYEYDTDNEEF